MRLQTSVLIPISLSAGVPLLSQYPIQWLATMSPQCSLTYDHILVSYDFYDLEGLEVLIVTHFFFTMSLELEWAVVFLLDRRGLGFEGRMRLR